MEGFSWICRPTPCPPTAVWCDSPVFLPVFLPPGRWRWRAAPAAPARWTASARGGWRCRVRQLRSSGRHDDGGAGIAPVIFQHRRDIDVKQVAGLDQPVLTRDAVRGFVVEADASVAGEAISAYRRGDGAHARHAVAADVVQIARAHAGFGAVQHQLQRQAADLADAPHAAQVFVAFDSHAAVLVQCSRRG